MMRVKKSTVTLVEPESETPGGPYFLSGLDQDSFPARTIYTYKNSSSEDTVILVDVLKKALAKVLVYYYPFAGSLAIDPNEPGLWIVDCTKKSVPFVEAEADCDIEFLGDIRVPNEHTTKNLIYMQDPSALLTVQVTRFKCGGFSLGVEMNHAIGDGVSGMNFMNSWAEIARGVPISVLPFHDRTLLQTRVPPQIKHPFDGYDEFVDISDVSETDSLYHREPTISRKFTFDSEKLASFKKKAAAKDGTTFSALAALIWQARSKALKLKPHQLTKLKIVVDLRSKLKEALPSEAYFGNLVTAACCLTTAGELDEQPLSKTVDHIRKSCQLVNDEEYIRSKIDYIHVHRPKLPSNVGTFLITSWTRLAYGCTDFGWGDPIQFGCANVAREVCIFLPHQGDKGITVVLALPLTAMKTFDHLVAQF